MSAREPEPAADEEANMPGLEVVPELAHQLEPFVQPGRMDEAVGVVSMMIAQSHSGPIPSPRSLSEYERVLPGAAERIMAMAEGEQKHRQGIEAKAIDAELKFKGRGQMFALVGMLACLGVVAYVAWLGHPNAAAAIATSVIAAVVALFLGQKFVPKGQAPRASED